jgi:uncharacterized protein (TIGR03437 family)
MRIIAAAVAIACGTALVAQQPATRDLTGMWEFTASSSGSHSGVVEIVQSSSGNLSGQFRSSSGTTAITGHVPSSREDMYIIRSGMDMAYWGNFGTDDNTLQGSYGIGRGTVLGTWRGKRISGNGPPRVAAVVNAAGGLPGAIAPGEIISIYANGATNAIGPQTGTGPQVDQETSRVSSSVGSVRVEFVPIGAFAPLTYISAGQINAVVPYEVAGLSETQIRVHYQNRVSDLFRVQVAETAPAIFTADGTGVGRGAILNHDGGPNGPTRREPRGGTVTLYLTGAGQTAPPGVSGQITTVAASGPLTPQPLAGATVRVNGQPARILFYGEAPGLISGAIQLNVEIPTLISAGDVPIQVTIGGRSTRDGVTVSVE